jgi:serine O-acetyltransferase
MGLLALARSIRDRDAACPSLLEVILCYPGFHIMAVYHPLAHLLYGMKLRLPARIWSQTGRFFTGIEIHPGAKIGRNLFIDHGMGVVIGETATVGDDCLIYHDVTLGGRGSGPGCGKRHPDIGNNVTIGANAQVLGPIAVGDGASVGAGSVVTRAVPPGVTVMGAPARPINTRGAKTYFYGLPDTICGEDFANQENVPADKWGGVNI